MPKTNKQLLGERGENIVVKRKPLSKDAKRAGWQGFYYDLTKIDKSNIRRVF